MNQYNIYLVNQEVQSQIFWCFLDAPQGLGSKKVYANSEVSLEVKPFNPHVQNSFTVPVQYQVEAGASNQAVKPKIEITSMDTYKTNTGEMWQVDYTTVPPNEGPSMNQASSPPPNSQPPSSSQILLSTNAFNQKTNIQNNWYESMSFGIMTEAGYIGTTWSPDPSETYTITPKLKFYIATGKYESNSLASYSQVSNGSAIVDTAQSFDAQLNCTVTLNSSGQWSVTPGLPPAS